MLVAHCCGLAWVRRTAQFSIQKCDSLLIPDLVLGAGEAMRRREFIILFGGAAAAWPLVARAQQPGKVFRIGFLGVSRDAPGTAANYKAFSDELRENGFSEGQNLIIEYRRSDDPRGVL